MLLVSACSSAASGSLTPACQCGDFLRVPRIDVRVRQSRPRLVALPAARGRKVTHWVLEGGGAVVV
jgi:hypothetical protein